MISAGFRRWLPPICLAAVIVAVWALPYRPDCDSLAWDNDPAIARVGSECIFLSHYAERLRTIEKAIEHTEQGLLADHPSEYQRQWYDRVNFYGAETVALAGAIRDSVLYQRAVAGGHTPYQEAVSARLYEDRLRWESYDDFIQLVKLAQNQDFAGFRKLVEETRNPDITNNLQHLTLHELMEALQDLDWRLLEQMQNEGEAYVESIGRERYWQEILPAKLRREMAISKLESAILDASAYGPDGPYAEVPRLGWLAYQQEALKEVSIELTIDAPSTVSVDRALAYLTEVRMQEQEELSEEYRRLLERRGERRRLTPIPPRP